MPRLIPTRDLAPPVDSVVADDAEIPLSYGDTEAEFALLARGRALVDCAGFRVVRVTGRDAADYLNRRLCQKVVNMAEGEWRRAGLLDALGKIQHDLVLGRDAEGFTLLTPGHRGAELAPALARFIFSEDCTVSDVTAESFVLVVVGGDPGELAGCAVVHSDLVAGERLVVGPLASLDAVGRGLLDVGYRFAGWAAFDAWRVRLGVPWWGSDHDTGTIPLEADLDAMLHFDKGCYPGQETIAKITNLGHPARKLLRVVFPPESPVGRGESLLNDAGVEVGRVTSVAGVPAGEPVVALAWIKWLHRAPGTVVRGATGNARGELAALSGGAS